MGTDSVFRERSLRVKHLGHRICLRDSMSMCNRQAQIVDGVYYDSVGYGVLRQEWRERYLHRFERTK